MKEYIERTAAVKAAQAGADEWGGDFNRNRDTYIEAAIDEVPTADVVAVVRCKDCMFSCYEFGVGTDLYYCGGTGLISTPDAFCSRGLKNEDGHIKLTHCAVEIDQET